jgi:hypothetical protein
MPENNVVRAGVVCVSPPQPSLCVLKSRRRRRHVKESKKNACQLDACFYCVSLSLILIKFEWIV